MERNRLRILMEVSIMAALSFVLDQITIFAMPQGGSITLSMLPIILIAYRWGLKSSLLTGFLSGLIQLIASGKIFHWIQPLVDYTLAYTVVGFAAVTTIWLMNGVKENNKGKQITAIVVGTFIGGLLRFAVHFYTGIVFFGAYAPEDQPVWLYSLVYNASYMVPSIILCMIVAAILFTTAPRLLKTTA